MCMLRDCAVCECEDHEVPQVWKTEERQCTGKLQSVMLYVIQLEL